MSGGIDIYPHPEHPDATVVRYHGRTVLYIYPTTDPDGWSYASARFGHGGRFPTRSATFEAAIQALQVHRFPSARAVAAALQLEQPT